MIKMETDEELAKTVCEPYHKLWETCSCVDCTTYRRILEVIKKSREGYIKKERITNRMYELKGKVPYMVCGIGHQDRKMIVGELKALLE